MKIPRIALIWRVLIACVLGCLLGKLLPLPVVRVFTTFNYIFSQYIGFMVPLIIVGLVTPAICKMGDGAGKLLLTAIVMAYCSSVLAGVFSYGVSSGIFPGILDGIRLDAANAGEDSVTAFFTLDIPPFMNVTSALVFSFLAGILMTSTGKGYFRDVVLDFEELVTKAIEKTLIPLLPIFIFGIFLKMAYSGEMLPVLKVFAKVIVVIFAMSIVWLITLFCISGIIARKNPFKSEFFKILY